MNPEIKESESPAASVPSLDADTPPAINLTDEPPLLPPASTSETNEQLRQFGERVYTFLSGLPDYLSEFFGEYRRPIITIGLIFGSIVSVKLTLALLGAINDIPLLAPTFELIGFTYVAWFIYRYLWKASSRQDLAKQVNAYKEQILGKGSSKV